MGKEEKNGGQEQDFSKNFEASEIVKNVQGEDTKVFPQEVTFCEYFTLARKADQFGYDKYSLETPPKVRGDNREEIGNNKEEVITKLNSLKIKIEKYIKARKELESKGFQMVGRGLMFLKDEKGEIVRDENGKIISEAMYFGMGGGQ